MDILRMSVLCAMTFLWYPIQGRSTPEHMSIFQIRVDAKLNLRQSNMLDTALPQYTLIKSMKKVCALNMCVGRYCTVEGSSEKLVCIH